MTRHNFSELSDFEFEGLCRDLFEVELGIRLEMFTPGRDSGIDLRHLHNDGSSLVIQCKLWAPKAYASLKGQLERLERPKIQRLSPSRYILATSVEMTPARKAELANVLSPWLNGPSDIFGRDDLAGLIARHPEVERRHIKLWLTSTEVLDALLNSGIATRTADFVERLQRQLRLWVPNPSFSRAQEVLDAHHTCVIAGPPGIGKTMLADILVADYVAQEFEPVLISSDIDEGDRLWNTDRKQIFFYDDFLGHISYGELRLGKNEEGRIASFINRVRKSKNKRFLLTTREYILREATLRYERLANVPISDVTMIVDLTDYSERIRAEILYNHLFFSNLPANLRAALLPNRVYWRVIRHRNYNPRIIEHAVELSGKVEPNEFVGALLRTLENPSEVWERVYENLSPMARDLLLGLSSLPPEVFLDDVEAVTRSLYSHAFESQALRDALRTLEGTFIRIDKAGRTSESRLVVSFRDPSVQDYLAQRLRTARGEAERVLNRAVFFEQCAAIARGCLDGSGKPRIDLEMAQVAKKAFELLDGPSCLVMDVSGSGGVFKMRSNSTNEERIDLIARWLVNAAPASDLIGDLQRACANLRQQWHNLRGDPEDGLNLLRSLYEFPGLEQERARLSLELLGLISTRLDDLDGFRQLSELEGISPEVFEPPNAPMKSWAPTFEDMIGSVTWADEDDANWLEEQGLAAEELGLTFDVDVSSALEEIDERINLLREREAQQEQYEEENAERYQESAGPTNDTAYIDALFQSLASSGDDA